MGRTRDDCVSYFDVVEFYDNFRLYQCKYCSKNIKSSSSTRLKSHLKRCKGYKAIGDSVDAPFKKQLTELFYTYDLPKKLLQDKNFIRLFTLAPSMMKNIRKVFIDVLDDISNDIPASYLSKFNETVQMLRKKSSLVLSIDTLIDSLDRETFYLTVICEKRFYHLYVEEYTNTLLTDGRVFKKCQELFTKIDPSKFICIFSENQTVLNNAKKKVVQNFPNISNVTCSATLFHQLANKVLNQNTELCECLDKFYLIYDIIQTKEAINKYIKRLTREDIPTYQESRWCSIYDVLLFFLEKRTIIECALEEEKISQAFTDEFWDYCSEVINLLHPFSIALKITENSFSNLSNVYIPFLTIKNHLVTQSVSNILINDFVSKMNVCLLEFCYLINPLHRIEDIENMSTNNAEEFLLTQIDSDHEKIIQDFRAFVYKCDKFENSFESTSDPIVWWKLNRFHCDELCSIAVKYLSIPASSVSVKDNLVNVVDKLLKNNKMRCEEDLDKLVFTLQDNCV